MKVYVSYPKFKEIAKELEIDKGLRSALFYAFNGEVYKMGFVLGNVEYYTRVNLLGEDPEILQSFLKNAIQVQDLG